jgi:transposase
MGLELIEVVERRRRWSAEEKLKVLTDALTPGASITAVSERHGISRNLVYTWLRLAREGRVRGLSMATKPAAAFVPVKIEPERPAEPRRCALPFGGDPPRSLRRRMNSIEITLANGRVVKADVDIDPEALARIVAALDGGSAS